MLFIVSENNLADDFLSVYILKDVTNSGNKSLQDMFL